RAAQRWRWCCTGPSPIICPFWSASGPSAGWGGGEKGFLRRRFAGSGKQKLRHRFCLRRSLFFCAPPPRLDRAFPFVKLLQLVRHQVLHALALCAAVIVAIAFQQVDDTPNTETGTQSDDQSLKHFDSRVKEIHSHFLLRKRACGRSVHT